MKRGEVRNVEHAVKVQLGLLETVEES